MSTTDQVSRILSRDAVVREGLRRGIINTRGLARWLITTHGLTASEEAVLSAMRRSPWAKPAPDSPALQRVLQTSHIDTTANVCSVMLKGGLDATRLRAPLLRLLKAPPAFLRVVLAGDSIRLVMRDDHLAPVLRVLGEQDMDEVRRGLTEISIRQTKESLAAPGVVASIVGALSFQGINFFGIVRHKLALQLLVEEADTARALAALSGLFARQ